MRKGTLIGGISTAALLTTMALGWFDLLRENKILVAELRPSGLDIGVADKGFPVAEVFGDRPRLSPTGCFDNHIQVVQPGGSKSFAGIECNW